VDLGIEGRLALITGAGRGLGESIAQTLAREGATIVAVSRTQESLDELLLELPEGNHRSLTLDLEHSDAAEDVLNFMKREKLRPDIIVNNVGGNLGVIDPLCSATQWRKVFHLNLEVAIDINRHFIPDMRSNGWGRICHVSSVAASENQGPPAYCAAKAALNAYVRSVGRYVSSDNVVLTSVMPGAVLTKGGYWDVASRERESHVENYLSSRMAIRRFGRPEEISELVAFLCSQHASFCIGTNVLVDGGQGRSFYEG
jgi:3-oxoacyl-[acyl-carrier protein] reductase